MDSMTLYRGMDIGTAKPSLAERDGIPHHLIDVLDPWNFASVADYRRLAIETVAAIESRGKRALFVGGTALYLKALLRGLFDGPSADPIRRAEMENESGTALHDRLSSIDPPTAARLHPHDRRRVIRALEVFEATGLPLSAHQSGHALSAEGMVAFALERPRAELVRRIDARVLSMFDAGFVDEVRALASAPRPLHEVPAQAVGYREVLAMLHGETSLSSAISLIQARTRQFSKRQATWFRGLAEVRAFPVGTEETAEEIADRLWDARRFGIKGDGWSVKPIG